MNPTDLTRRNLAVSFMAFLFGWLWPDKNPKTPTQTIPGEPASAYSVTTFSTSVTTVSTYDLNGDQIDIKQVVRPVKTVCTYDAQNRLVKISNGCG